MNQIRMKVGIANGVEEERVLDGVKCFGDIDGDYGGAKRRLGGIKTIGDLGDSGKQGSNARVLGTETVLVRGRRKGGGEEGED